MPIVSIKELEARRAASLAATTDPASRANAAAVSPAGPETDRLPIRAVSARTSSLPPSGAASPTMSESDDVDADVEAEPSVGSVGYCRPPVASQFRKGDGRPRGPAKGSRRLKSLDAFYQKWLGQLTTARIGEKSMRITRAERLLLRQLEMAEKGDKRAIRDILERYDAIVPREESTNVVQADLTAADLATLAIYRAEIEAELSCNRLADDEDAL